MVGISRLSKIAKRSVTNELDFHVELVWQKHEDDNTTTRLMITVIMVRIPSALSRHHTEKLVKHSITNELRRLSHSSRIHLADTLTTRSRENGSESEGRETPQLQEMTSAVDTTVPLKMCPTSLRNQREPAPRNWPPRTNRREHCTPTMSACCRLRCRRCTRDGPCCPRPNRTRSARLT